MRRRLLPLVWICLGAWALASAAAAQAPDYGGDGLAGGPETRRSYGDPAYLAPARPNGKRPGSLEPERTGSAYEAEGRLYGSTVERGYVQVGIASWYGANLPGRRTDSGEWFDQDAMTVAHPTLPMHSLLQVTNPANGREVIVRVNDRGSFESSRLLDVTRAVAQELGFVRAGYARVQVRYLGPSPDRPRRTAGSGRPGGREYVVQIGAYARVDNARRAINRAVSDGWPVVVDPLPRRHRGLFRVRVGPWASHEEAQDALGDMDEFQYPDAFVTRR